jgi:Arc/MetJ-type ribon-helix-helix transcriptional regulator
MRDGLRLMMQEDLDKLELLREAVADGIESAERDELIPDDRILDEVRRRARKRLKDAG